MAKCSWARALSVKCCSISVCHWEHETAALVKRAAHKESLEMHPLKQLQVQREAPRNFSSWMDGPVCTSVSWNCIGYDISKSFITALHWWVGSGISDTFPWLWWLGCRKPQWSNRRLSKRKSQKDVYSPLSCVHFELVPSDSPISGVYFWLFCGAGAQNHIIGLFVSNC